MLTKEEKAARLTERREARRLAKEQARIAEEKEQRPVESITITIEWAKSRMWGSNPHATAEVRYKDIPPVGQGGQFERRGGFTCGGCGYDKESTVIAEIFNTFLKYKLWGKSAEEVKGGHGTGDKGSAPYGIRVSEYGRGYSGGIGTSCYYRIAEFIGGKFEKIAGGKTFDVFVYTDGAAVKSC